MKYKIAYGSAPAFEKKCEKLEKEGYKPLLETFTPIEILSLDLPLYNMLFTKYEKLYYPTTGDAQRF